MNIIFDIGGVTLSWSSELYLSHNFSNKEHLNAAYNHILNTPLWASLDKGTISYEDAIKISSEKSGLPEDTVEKLIDTIPDVLLPINATIDIIKELKGKDHKLYVLSNMGLKAADAIEEKYNFWDLFDGILFSSRIKMIKPDDEIFHHLADKYNLTINNSIFIDDTKENIIAADKLGFKTIHFESADQCRKELVNFKCL
jgi:HAD superfamily hydrolase (TIGR01509 family)